MPGRASVAEFLHPYPEGSGQTVEDREHAYALYRGGRRVARFGFGRLVVRFDAERLPSLVGPVT
jgi:hypothetical protein